MKAILLDIKEGLATKQAWQLRLSWFQDGGGNLY